MVLLGSVSATTEKNGEHETNDRELQLPLLFWDYLFGNTVFLIAIKKLSCYSQSTAPRLRYLAPDRKNKLCILEKPQNQVRYCWITHNIPWKRNFPNVGLILGFEAFQGICVTLLYISGSLLYISGFYTFLSCAAGWFSFCCISNTGIPPLGIESYDLDRPVAPKCQHPGGGSHDIDGSPRNVGDSRKLKRTLPGRPAYQ